MRKKHTNLNIYFVTSGLVFAVLLISLPLIFKFYSTDARSLISYPPYPSIDNELDEVTAEFKVIHNQAVFPAPLRDTSDLSSTFGPRLKDSSYDFHKGIDISSHGMIGEDVVNAYTGDFVDIKFYPEGGLTVIVEHQFPNPVNYMGSNLTSFYTLYMHLDSVDQTIVDADTNGTPLALSAGDRIGALGQSGTTTTPHLHFEVRIGTICSLEYQLNNPGSSCAIGYGFDPHINPLMLFPEDKTEIEVNFISCCNPGNDIQVQLKADRSNPAINRVEYQNYDSTSGSIIKSYTLDFNLRDGFDATTNANLDIPDQTRPYMSPDIFNSLSTEYTTNFIIPGVYLADATGDVHTVIITDVWGNRYWQSEPPGLNGIVNPNPPAIGGCQIFPTDNPWNQEITDAPVHSNSNDYLNFIGSNDNLHPDFGTFWLGSPIGIPYIVVDETQPDVPTEFIWYPDESDPGPYPIPLDAPIEGGSDAHVLAVDKDECMLYEMFAATPLADRWQAGNGAIFDLKSNALRPDGWTSADAAGLPIFAGLVRYDEVMAGEIKHALRFTVDCTAAEYIYPATHYAVPGGCSPNANTPPMGLRFRLKQSWYDSNIGNFSGQALPIVKALRNYGMIIADNGSDWFISGEHNPNWDDDQLGQIKTIPATAFEVIDSSNVVPNTTQVQPSIDITDPGGTGDTADSSYFIAWTDSDPDSNADINLFYDTDNFGKDGTQITDCGVILEDGPDSCVWGTSGIPEGDYYIYAEINDGVYPSVFDYSSGPVTIDHVDACSQLLCNPSFEDGLNYWVTKGDSDNQVSTDAIDGSQSLRSEHTRTALDVPSWSGVSQAINSVEPAQTYGLSMWVKSLNASRGHVKIRWYDSGMNLSQVDYPIINIDGTIGNWSLLSKLVTSPPDAASAKIFIWHGVNVSSQNVLGSTLWVDGIELDVATSSCGTLCNESFEHGVLYWTQSGAVGSHTIETNNPHEGLKVLRSEQIYGGGDPVKWAGVTQFAQVKAGTYYRLRLWLKAENASNGHTRIRWRDSNGNILSIQYPISGINDTNLSWFKREAFVTAPANAAKAEVAIWHGVTGGTANSTGSTLWVDDITFICQNLCNAGFEDGNVHWESNGKNEGEIVTTDVQEGARAMKVTQNLTSSDMTQWAGVSQRVIVSGGSDYDLYIWVKKLNTVQGHVKIKWRDSNDQLISTQYPKTGMDGTDAAWISHSMSLSTPPNAETAEIFIWHGVDGSNQNATGSTLHLDNITFDEIP